MDRMVSPRTPYRGRRSPRARMYRRPLFLLTALVLAGILIPLSRSEQVPPAPGSDPAASEPGVSSGPPPVTVEVDRVEPELLRDVATFSGQLDAEYSVLLKPETDGVIEAITFAEGQVVRKDDVLYRLRGGEQRARLREAQATLALKREEYGRTQKLLERNAVSLAQEDRAEAELEVAKARVELAQLELDRTEIRAPFDGVVGQRLVSPGDRVTEDDELVRIDAVDRLQLRFATATRSLVGPALFVWLVTVLFDRWMPPDFAWFDPANQNPRLLLPLFVYFDNVDFRGLSDLLLEVLSVMPLGFLLASRSGRWTVGRAAVWGLLLGIVLQGVQYFHLDRTAEMTDVLAGGLGAALGVLLWRWAQRVRAEAIAGQQRFA